MNYRYLSSFTVSNNEVLLSDPSLEYGADAQILANNVRNGKWSSFRIEFDDGTPYPMLFIIHDEFDFSDFSITVSVFEDKISADSGIIGIFSADQYRLDADDIWHERIAKALPIYLGPDALPFGAVTNLVTPGLLYECRVMSIHNKHVGFFIDTNPCEDKFPQDILVDAAYMLTHYEFGSKSDV